MATRKKPGKRPAQREKKDDLRPYYEQMRKEFSAADLQKYTEIEVGIPAEEVLAEMKAIHREVMRKKKK